MFREREPRGRRAALAVALLLGALVAGPGSTVAAGAQEGCDPTYGCEPTEPPVVGPVSCSTAASVVAPGDTVEVAVSGAPAGSKVDLTYDGAPVGSANANDQGGARISFVVPPTSGPGPHSLFAVGAAFSSTCGSLTGVAVQGTQVTQTPGGGSGTGTGTGAGGAGAGRSGGGQSLARTGLELGLYLAVALALLVVGTRLVAVARRRRRRAARRLNAVAALERRG